MPEMVFDIVQFGRQATDGTAVAATTLYPAKVTAIELDRGYLNPDEDYGRMDDEQPGRGSFGLRGATASLEAVARFEDFMQPMEAHAAGGIVPTGTNPYTWAYTADSTADTAKRLTIELGSEVAQDQWRLVSALFSELSVGFDALEAPGNQPYSISGSIEAFDREVSARTPGLAAAPGLETIEGHQTTLSEGSTSTAFGSLAELSASLIAFRWTSRRPWVRRAYAAATGDKATAWGLSEKAGVTFEAELRIAAGTKAAVYDQFTAAGSAVVERRWRVRSFGSGTKTLTTDARVRYRVVGRGERQGEATYAVQGSMVYDATLGGRIQVAVVNAIATLP